MICERTPGPLLSESRQLVQLVHLDGSESFELVSTTTGATLTTGTLTDCLRAAGVEVVSVGEPHP